MRYAFVVLLAALLAPLAALAQPPDKPSDAAPNAAVQYWQAFHHMPTLTKEQEEILHNWQKTPLDEPAQKLIEASRTSLMYLHRGAKIPQCDWGLDYNDGISMLMPHLAKARQLALLAALRGRSEFEQGNRKAARTDAMAMMVLSRHVGRDPVMICLLVRYLVEGLVVDLVAPYIPELKASPEAVLAEFKSLPPAVTLRHTLETEKKYFAGYIVKELKRVEQEKPGSWRPLWKAMLGEQPPEELKKVESLDQLVKWVEDSYPMYDALEKLVVLPPREFDEQYPAFKVKAEKANPAFKVLLPAIDKIRGQENRANARMEMLLAATRIAVEGPEAAKQTKDPFGDGPFQYRARDGGFELKSQLMFEEKDVVLVIGKTKDTK